MACIALFQHVSTPCRRCCRSLREAASASGQDAVSLQTVFVCPDQAIQLKGSHPAKLGMAPVLTGWHMRFRHERPKSTQRQRDTTRFRGRSNIPLQKAPQVAWYRWRYAFALFMLADCLSCRCLIGTSCAAVCVTLCMRVRSCAAYRLRCLAKLRNSHAGHAGMRTIHAGIRFTYQKRF